MAAQKQRFAILKRQFDLPFPLLFSHKYSTILATHGQSHCEIRILSPSRHVRAAAAATARARPPSCYRIAANAPAHTGTLHSALAHYTPQQNSQSHPSLHATAAFTSSQHLPSPSALRRRLCALPPPIPPSLASLSRITRCTHWHCRYSEKDVSVWLQAEGGNRIAVWRVTCGV